MLVVLELPLVHSGTSPHVLPALPAGTHTLAVTPIIIAGCSRVAARTVMIVVP